MDEKEFNKEWKDGEIVKYAKEYDENAFWEKLKKFGRKAGIKVCYAALLLYYVLKSPLTSGKDRAKIIGALGYFLLPIDIIPDFSPSPATRTTSPPSPGASIASSRASPPK